MYVGKYNFDVIIVDDNSNDKNRLEDEIKHFSFPINLIVITTEEKGNRINPCIAYNRGFAEATGDIIVIQNPECYHVGDILGHVQNNLAEQDYFSYSCFSANSSWPCLAGSFPGRPHRAAPSRCDPATPFASRPTASWRCRRGRTRPARLGSWLFSYE